MSLAYRIVRLPHTRAIALSFHSSRNHLVASSSRSFSSANDEHDKFKSLLSPSKVRSPYANPSRTRASPLVIADVIKETTQNRQLSSEKPSSVQVPEVVTKKDGEQESDKFVEESSKDQTTTTTAETADRIESKKAVEREPIKFVDEPAKGQTTATTETANRLTREIEEQYKLAQTLPKTSAFRRFKDQWGLSIDESASDEEKKRQKTTRNTKIGFFFLFGSAVAGVIGFCLHYGRAARDEHGNVIRDEFSGSLFASFQRIFKAYRDWKDYMVEPSREKLLPDPLPEGYIQPKYTIVIEMKNVLVSPEWTYKTGYRFKLRPALDYFLDVVGYPNFEVVIYTCESSMTADPIIQSFDPKQRIMYRLYRDCTKYHNGHHIKDLSRLNRDLSKVIHIDFDPTAFSQHPENVLRIPKWEGDMSDTSLVDLAELLKTIHLSDVEDVRPVLEYYSSFDDPAKEFRKRALYLAEQEASTKSAMEAGQESSLVKRYTGRLFGFRRHAQA
ncbi:hypothetical protein PMAYCL1PPCAC_30094 [Pristionchus mayeri]|uniref:Mitochondrial import inner membrane translocase subunit TIM50 n=1 Tax=Pristionchus mayeri TaxID=1317129 RepID=A0AAN5DB98_9BILA|nr:hypothetical protein PMAYCL1PPCAC_30094 [Pristionchus mayeri]